MRHLASIAVLVWAGAAAAELDSQGQVTLESRGFINDENRVTTDQGVGLSGRIEFEDDGETLDERIRVFGRLDAYDDERTTLVLEEAWVEGKVGPLRLRVGFDLVNWTATEAFHPADVLNARNLDSDLENLEKLGEPMAMASMKLLDGSISVYYLPVLMKPNFASPSSRLAFVPGLELGERLVMDEDGAISDGDYGHQAAVRIAQQFGSADISVQAVHHADRSQPTFVFDPATLMVRPLFQTVTHLGLTYSHAIDALLVKVEAAYRRFWQPEGDASAFGPLPDRSHAEVAVGLEYNLPHDNGWESTLLAEGQTFLGVEAAIRQNLSPFQNDVLVGYRLAFNDEDSKELLATFILDVELPEQMLGSISYRQRLGEVWGVTVSARGYFAPEPTGAIPVGLEAWRDADHVRVAITRYF